MNQHDCPNKANHTPGPDAYLEWHAWATKMKQTHKQERCPQCGLYLIWTPRNGQPEDAVETLKRIKRIE